MFVTPWNLQMGANVNTANWSKLYRYRSTNVLAALVLLVLYFIWSWSSGGSLPTHCSQVATTVIIILQLFSFLGVIESTLLLRNLHNIHY